MDDLGTEIEIQLLQEVGSPMMNLKQLARAMSYPSVSALQRAITRQTVPVAVFKVANRRGKFALVKDVAAWMAAQRAEAARPITTTKAQN